MQQWYSWLFDMNKKDEEMTMEVEHQKLDSRMIAGARRRSNFAAQHHETNSMERKKTTTTTTIQSGGAPF